MKHSRIQGIHVIGAAGVGVVVLFVAGCAGAAAPGAAGPTVPAITSSSEPPVATVPAEPPPTSAAAGQPAPAEPPEVALSGECKAGELTLSLGQGEGAAGTVYRPLRFTNAGRRTCTIQGFPGVSYVTGDDGHQVGPAAFRDGTKGPAVSLAPGATANAPVGFTQVRNFDPNVCQPTPVRGLRVYPPHDTAAMFLPMDGTGCAGTPPGNQLVVRTVQSGQGA